MIHLNKPANLNKFASFLIENGAKILEPTNQWEVLRYRIQGAGVVVIYKKASGALNVPSIAQEHLTCFEKGRAIERKERPGKNHKATLIERLMERDGDECCICGKSLGDDITVEHWVAIKAGGNNMLENLALAHKACNRAVDSKPVTEKLKIAMKMRSIEK